MNTGDLVTDRIRRREVARLCREQEPKEIVRTLARLARGRVLRLRGDWTLLAAEREDHDESEPKRSRKKR